MDKDIILTDNSYLSWIILSYCVLDVTHKQITAGFAELYRLLPDQMNLRFRG